MLGVLEGLKVITIVSSNIIKAVEMIMGQRDIKTCIKTLELGRQVVSSHKI